MPFVFPSSREEKKSSLSTLSRDELFEVYMLEIGQYRKNSEGKIELVGWYIKSADLANNFKDWLKKKV